MDLRKNVFKLAESFMIESEMVSLDYERIEKLAQQMLSSDPPSFPLPPVDDVFIDDTFDGIIYELIASSINYCYWYGNSNIRPNGASSTSMYNLMLNTINSTDVKTIIGIKTFNNNHLSQCIDKFERALCLNRFPLVEERIKHLNELKPHAINYCGKVLSKTNNLDKNTMKYLLNKLVELFPGFASDMFLKRAFLFFIQLYRRFGWFKEELKNCPVPADYQIPKMLNHFGCIKYHPLLDISIVQSKIIPKHSRDECEIRSATILAMRELCRLTGWNVADVDSYLFLRRHQVKKNFHLTITTDY